MEDLSGHRAYFSVRNGVPTILSPEQISVFGM